MIKLKNLYPNKKKIDETEFDAITKFDYLDNIKNSSKKISSFLTIQEGCDKFCHFCIVPFTRGPEYSRPFKKILEEAENLSENGVREITLLGQNVNAYNYENYRLSDLILEIEKLDGIKRIRYTTSHPRDMTEDLINVYGVSKKLMPLVHLPVQSGSDKILKSMNRKHQISDYVNTYEKLQKINPKIKFSSDFIIAYPGEDEKDFNQTCDLIKKIEFINSFSFIFSPRPGTTAANFKLIDKKISLTRLEKVQKQLFTNQINMNKSLEGKEIDVLVENKIDGFSRFFEPIRNDLSISYAQMSLVFSLQRAEGSVAGPLVGWLVDNYGARPMILFGGLCAGIGLICVAYVQTYWQLIFLFVGLVSLGKSAGLGQTLMGLVNRWFIRKRQSRCQRS